MIDFVFAMIAAGVNSAGGSGGSDSPSVVAAVPPAQQEAPAVAAAPTETAPTATAPTATAPTAPTVSSPSVSLGENVTIGGGGIIGGAPNASSSGGASLLDGTTEEIGSQTAPAVSAAVPSAPAAPAAPANDGFIMSVVPPGLVPDDQSPTGKFTTATEVKPILSATRGNWVAVREYDGKDLLYVTHLWSWRCGLHAMAISVNDEPMQNWPLPPCHNEYSTPNAVLEGDGFPFLTLRLKSVEKIEIQIVYDDLSMDRASFARGDVLIP